MRNTLSNVINATIYWLEKIENNYVDQRESQNQIILLLSNSYDEIKSVDGYIFDI